jgi:hypothetical protein
VVNAWSNRSMRYSLLFPILLVLGMGCVVREPAYTTGYVAYGTYDPYPVYTADGYYWAYYGDSWYWWSHDHWVYSSVRPHRPVVISNHGGWGSGGHGSHGNGNVVVRDHRGDDARGRGNGRGNDNVVVRDHRGNDGRGRVRMHTSAPPRSAPPPRASAPRAAPSPRVRDHRR